MKLTLYHYWRSSSSWRVRWALNYKKQNYEPVHVSLLDGESESPAHLKRNPLGFVPALDIDGRMLIESVAIIEWLEEMIPSPNLYPPDSFARAHIRALVEVINADTQPVQNLSVLDQYSDEPQKRKNWMQYFIARGLSAYETLVSKTHGSLSFGNQLSTADLFLIPQVYNALRNELDMRPYPIISKIYENALKLPSCQASHPDRFKPQGHQ